MPGRYIEVMRHIDAPHVFLPASKEMRARTDILELAWLDTQTQKTYAYDAKPSEKPEKPARKSRQPKEKSVDTPPEDLSFLGLN
jgi:hypothetical protein